jgi:Spy/CpxP family protein refolding chaperone
MNQSKRVTAGHLLVAGLLVLWPSVTRATPGQPAPTPTPGAGAGDMAPKPRKQEKERLREQLLDEMRTMRMWRLTEELKLDETTAAKVFPLLARYDDRERELSKERNQATKDLRRALDNPNPDKPALNLLLDRVIAARAKKSALDQEKAEALRKVLTPVEAARMLLLLPKIDEAFRDRIKEALRKSQGDNAPAR